jgi:hypothetical protein
MAPFNRIVTTLILLALIPIVTIALIVPQEAIEVLQDGLSQIEDNLDTSVSAWEMLIRIGIALIIGVVLVLLVYLELRRPAEYGVPVRRMKAGEAQIAVDSIVDRLTYRIDQLPGVLSVEPELKSQRRGVEVALEIEAAADAQMRANLEEISAVARQVIEDEMGLKLKGKPKLNLRTVVYPEPSVSETIPQTTFAPLEDQVSAQELPRIEDSPEAPPALDEDVGEA